MVGRIMRNTLFDFKGELPFDIAIIAMGILLIFIGSMLIIGVRSFEKEEDSNKIYAFTASF